MVTTSALFYLVFLGLLGLERIAELLVSRRNAERAFAKGAVEVGQAHYRVMRLFHTAFLAACAAEVLLLQRPFPGLLGFVCLALALLAQALRYWAITTLGERWNVRILVLPDTAPVTSGPYRYLRHPNYLAVVIEMAAIPLIHGAYLTAIAFSLGNAALLFVRIRAEERALGSGYSQAFAHKRRFLPGIGGAPQGEP